MAGAVEVLIPMAGLIDKEAELRRLAKELEKLRAGLERARAKLANPSFVEKAPAAVVEKERRRAAELERAIAGLEAQAERIRAL